MFGLDLILFALLLRFVQCVFHCCWYVSTLPHYLLTRERSKDDYDPARSFFQTGPYIPGCYLINGFHPIPTCLNYHMLLIIPELEDYDWCDKNLHPYFLTALPCSIANNQVMHFPHLHDPGGY